MPKETFHRLRDEKQEKIIRSAIGEFNEHGFERAKIGDIAKNAGVATGSIYQYFEDKNELFVYSVEWAIEIFMKKLDARMNITDMDIFEYFDDTLSKIEVINEERELVKFMEVMVHHPDPGLLRESLSAAYEKNATFIKSLIRNSKNKRLIRDDIDDEILMEYFIGITERFKLRWMQKNVDFTNITMLDTATQKELKQIVDLIKTGMGSKSDVSNNTP